MTKVYLTGAVSDWDDPFAWHDQLVEDYPNHDFVNPYTLNDFELGDDAIYKYPEKVVEPALSAVESSDSMLVRWDDDAFLVGTSMEMKHAFEHDVPIIIWYDGWRDNLSPWLLHVQRGQWSDLDKCVEMALAFGGDKFTITGRK